MLREIIDDTMDDDFNVSEESLKKISEVGDSNSSSNKNVTENINGSLNIKSNKSF
ncbi:hypothetical protein SAMN05216249_104131 [Acetitomaculum ruminis DSM 5522]|uniref:Uncharacterized protein n=1 Tax=Acetitomaculum ruminis DSM 5522 TaxID=1120918 RepID=A0A1I0WM07_9FIRM|nr:hypothetical protein [Acetitomaculum ruminis]SFA89190.1 hypothetical protein SAMN05216249_104131 [Acetitomaculum ruminis DSM 5522]